MKMIKGWGKACTLMLATIFLGMSCSDKDYYETPPTPAEQQIQDVIKELEKVEGVSEFVQALKEAGTTITTNLEEERLTVFAPKSYSKTRAGDDILKRHIVKGAKDIKNFSGDTLKLEALSGEKLYVVKTDDGDVLINGIPLAQNNRITAGNSYIYIVPENLPAEEVFLEPKYEVRFNVLECNTNFSAENNAETFPSKNALIRIYKKNDIGEYNVIDSVKTDAKGHALLRHNYTFDLYYQVEKESMYMKLDGYIPVGVFTSQTEIDAAPVYNTGTSLDKLKPGALKLADVNGDMVINESDRLTSDYFQVDRDVDEVIVYLAPPLDGLSQEIYFKTAEDLRDALFSIKELYRNFVIVHSRVDFLLKEGIANYPSLSNLREIETLWGMGWQYIQIYLQYKRAMGNSSDHASFSNVWNNSLCDSEFAYVYLTLVNCFGDIPLFTEPSYGVPQPIVRNPKTEIVAYLESIVKDVSTLNHYAMKTLLARYHANEGNYDWVKTFTDEIINSGDYSLVSKPFGTTSNPEVVLGGYRGVNNDIFHPIRYREVILLAAEAAFELGENPKALQYVNQIRKVNGQSEDQMVTRDAIRALWNTEFVNEGMDYMLLNRWGTLMDVLGQYGAKDFNNLLPIPSMEVIYGLKQNPGYN